MVRVSQDVIKGAPIPAVLTIQLVGPHTKWQCRPPWSKVIKNLKMAQQNIKPKPQVQEPQSPALLSSGSFPWSPHSSFFQPLLLGERCESRWLWPPKFTHTLKHCLNTTGLPLSSPLTLDHLELQRHSKMFSTSWFVILSSINYAFMFQYDAWSSGTCLHASSNVFCHTDVLDIRVKSVGCILFIRRLCLPPA